LLKGEFPKTDITELVVQLMSDAEAELAMREANNPMKPVATSTTSSTDQAPGTSHPR
jgi:hypothetical protein